ncbi:helix-turn-helix transcriptional regulator [Streptomyces sp. NPDC048639]|uniref:helix-turn-helix transcriptional regulator n=1 Tax=Streptomyces sp. NPDC048639 TaxID=3365581 RepID=UPI00371467B4
MRNSVRDRRAAAGLSQAALAELIGVSRQTVNAIETGKWDPSLPVALKLARTLSTTVEELFDDTEDTEVT